MAKKMVRIDGEALRRAIRASGYTQTDLASTLSVSLSSISTACTRGCMSRLMFDSLCRCINVPQEVVLEGPRAEGEKTSEASIADVLNEMKEEQKRFFEAAEKFFAEWR